MTGVSLSARRALHASLFHGKNNLQQGKKGVKFPLQHHTRQLAASFDHVLFIQQNSVLDFIENFELRKLDSDSNIVYRTKTFVLDTIGVTLSGTLTPCSKAAYSFAKDTAGGLGAIRLWLDGQIASAPAVAMAHALTCDSLDMHDSIEIAQGHCGVVVVPSAFALARANNNRLVSGEALLESIIVGYEVGLRAGVRLNELQNELASQLKHSPPAAFNKLCYPSSEAWNAIGAAAASARLLQLSRGQTREALGISEYFGPRSMMMRCISSPTMLKDGAGMGAFAGVSAAILAKKCFTGAPAETVDESSPWDSIGEYFMLNEQVIKKFAVCYWSQAAMQGALDCLRALGLEPSDTTAGQVQSVKVDTSSKGVSLNHPCPSSTEVAQYSLQFSVAAAMVHGVVGAKEVMDLTNMVVITLSEKIKAEEKREYTEIYPHQFLADVEVKLNDGGCHKVEGVLPPWPKSDFPEEEDVKEKFFTNVTQVLSFRRARDLYSRITDLEDLTAQQVGELLDQLERE